MEKKDGKSISRRSILIGGGIAGAAALTGGFILFRREQQAPADKHLRVEAKEPFWNGVTWGPDSMHISWITEDRLVSADLKDGAMSEKPLGYPIADLRTLARSGTRIASIDSLPNMQIVVQDAQSGHLLWTYKDPRYSGDRLYSINDVAWSPDGTRLALVFRRDDLSDNHTDSVLQVRDTASWKVIWEYQERTVRGFDPYAITWSPDGTLIAAVHSDTVQYLDALSGHLLYAWPSIGIWSADARFHATSLTETQGQRMVIQVVAWEARTGKKVFQKEISQDRLDYPRIAWSPDGTRLAVREQQQIQVWALQTMKLLFTCQHVEGDIYAVSWSPDGRYIVARKNPNQTDTSPRVAQLQFWNAHNGNALFAYNSPRMPTGYGRPAQMYWSPDSRFLALDNKKDWGCSYDLMMGKTDCSFSNDVIQVFQIP